MKKTILALCLAGTLFACKKETNTDEAPASQSKVPVTFSLENFLVSQQDYSDNGRVEADPSLSGFFRIFYMAFKSDGSLVSYIEQNDSTNVNFGIISDSLLPGTYTVAIGAHNRLGHYATYIKANNYNTLATAEFYNMYARTTSDFFYKKSQVTVTAGNTSINDVTLNRINGYLKVDLKDALPASDPNGAVTITVGNIPQSYMINTDVATNISSGVPIDRRSQTTWDYNIFGSANGLSVTIDWKDKVTGAPQTKKLNVLVTANKKTIVTGYLYGVPTNVAGAFVTRTNQAWSSDSTVYSIN